MRILLLPLMLLICFAVTFAQVKNPIAKIKPTPAREVVVEKTNGDRITGSFVSGKTDSITIIVSGSNLQIPFNEISSLRFSRDTPNLLKIVNPAENPQPSPVATATPRPRPLPSETVFEVQINKKPLTDFAYELATSRDAKEIDLNQNFLIVLDGVITKDGKLDRTKSKFDVSKEKGDPKMIAVGKSALEAFSDSGYLTYLALLGIEKINATLAQDEEKIVVVITSAERIPERAKTLSSQLRGVIMVGKMGVPNPSDERTLLDGTNVTSDGAISVLTFAIPKTIAHEMIARKLKEAQVLKAAEPRKPN